MAFDRFKSIFHDSVCLVIYWEGASSKESKKHCEMVKLNVYFSFSRVYYLLATDKAGCGMHTPFSIPNSSRKRIYVYYFHIYLYSPLWCFIFVCFVPEFHTCPGMYQTHTDPSLWFPKFWNYKQQWLCLIYPVLISIFYIQWINVWLFVFNMVLRPVWKRLIIPLQHVIKAKCYSIMLRSLCEFLNHGSISYYHFWWITKLYQ